MAESSNTHSGQNRLPRQRSITPRNLNLSLESPQDEYRHNQEEEHMEQQNLDAGGEGVHAYANFFTPHVGGTVSLHTHVTIPAHVYNYMIDNQTKMQVLITKMMASDQTRYKTPLPPPFNLEEDENTPVTHRELARILKGKGEASEPTWEINSPFGHHILVKSYLKGSAKKYILSFLDDLGVFRNRQELKIKDFSKSLTKRAFTWYAKLKSNIINT
ncbi:hypothetical protein Ahy_B09g097991 [Arachis hypogaea]|uniref:Uncharacterized protein n=1 Tax=Arachis hypogaea TaxID=3818 RepID=A0A444XQX4_ARAHY|nr:hypothetical protein Ahy_B09g097991 [Arachis hypogaea]